MKPWQRLFLLLFFLPLFTLAQEEEKPELIFSAYLETYYGFDFSRPENGERPGYVYSHNRHNEVNLNIGLLKAAYSSHLVRASLALAAGTYMNANYAAEPGVLKNIFEANVGVKLAKSANLWLDAGILPSHIGFESAVSKDCYTLTRSMMADNSPYFEAGMKLGYTTTDEKLYAAVLWLNGWQRITRVSGNSVPSFGTQLVYKPSDKLTLNWSSFVGNDYPDSLRKMRYYNNFYGIYEPGKRWGFIAGFDMGMEQVSKGAAAFHNWFTPVVIARFSPARKWSVAGRMEYYRDPGEVIIKTSAGNGFSAFGGSLNLDFLPADQVAVRVEGKVLRGQGLLTLSLAAAF